MIRSIYLGKFKFFIPFPHTSSATKHTHRRITPTSKGNNSQRKKKYEKRRTGYVSFGRIQRDDGLYLWLEQAMICPQRALCHEQAEKPRAGALSDMRFCSSQRSCFLSSLFPPSASNFLRRIAQIRKSFSRWAPTRDLAWERQEEKPKARG